MEPGSRLRRNLVHIISGNFNIEIMNICELRSEELFKGRSSQLYTQLMHLRKESLKKTQACTGFEPLTSSGVLRSGSIRHV